MGGLRCGVDHHRGRGCLTGKGNRTEVKEAPSAFAEPPPMRLVHETREGMLFRPNRAKLPPLEELIRDLDTPEKTAASLYGLVERKDPEGVRGHQEKSFTKCSRRWISGTPP